jgi:hypothetical protein
MIPVIMFAIYAFPQKGMEPSFLYGVTNPFAVSLGFESIKQISVKNHLGIIMRTNIMLIPNPREKNGNTISSSCGLLNIIPGLMYKFEINKDIFIFPKIGPSVNLFITPGRVPGYCLGFGVSPELGIRLQRFEMGILSNVAITSPLSFEHWIGLEVGWRL